MSTLIIGFGLLVAIVAASLNGAASTYLQLHSFLIVVVGTFAVLIFSTSPPALRALWELMKTLFKAEDSLENYQTAIRALTENKNHKLQVNTHPLLTYASELWSQGVESELFHLLLSQKRNSLNSRGLDAVLAMKNLSKYPPALGMTGTVMGIVNVFHSLDRNKDSIGMNLAVAMTATFMGLILANLLISPLADRLLARQLRQERLGESLYDVILLINRDEPLLLIQGALHESAA